MKHISIANNANVSQIPADGNSDTFSNIISADENFTVGPLVPIDEQINLEKRQIDLLYELTVGETLKNEPSEWKTQTDKMLEDICKEAEEAYELDNEIDQIPPSAYKEASLLLDLLLDYDLPMPHIGWAEDGSLGFEWRPQGGIATMGIYGDNLVIYGVFFEKNRQVDGVCLLSDTALLGNFLETLRQIL